MFGYILLPNNIRVELSEVWRMMEVGVSVKYTSTNTTKLNHSNGLLKVNSVKIFYNYLTLLADATGPRYTYIPGYVRLATLEVQSYKLTSICHFLDSLWQRQARFSSSEQGLLYRMDPSSIMSTHYPRLDCELDEASEICQPADNQVGRPPKIDIIQLRCALLCNITQFFFSPKSPCRTQNIFLDFYKQSRDSVMTIIRNITIRKLFSLIREIIERYDLNRGLDMKSIAYILSAQFVDVLY